MYSFRKSKKGFTLIELMVVVAIIGVLALLGLRLYTTQQAKAKEAIVKANASTVHTIIQSEMADSNVNLTGTATALPALLDVTAGSEGSLLTANLRNPFSAAPMVLADFIVEADTDADAVADDAANEGRIHINVIVSTTGPGVADANDVQVQGYGQDGTPIPEVLTAKR